MLTFPAQGQTILRYWRMALLCWLALCLPVQGLAAVMMPFCHGMQQTQTATLGMDCHQTMAPAASADKAPDSNLASSSKTSAPCASCYLCSAGVMPPPLPKPQSAQALPPAALVNDAFVNFEPEPASPPPKSLFAI